MPRRLSRLLAMTGGLLVLCPAPLFALTADEVWADWQRLAREADAPLTATIRREGERLVLTDLVIPLGPPADRLEVKLQRVDLEDRADGSVAVLLPPEFPLMLDPAGDGPGNEMAVLNASAPGFVMTVTGIGATAAFDLSAPSVSLLLEGYQPPLPMDRKAEFNLALADLTLQHRMDLLSPTLTVLTTFSLGTLHGDLLGELAGPTERVAGSVDVSGLKGSLSAVIPPSVQAAGQEPPGKELNPLAELQRFVADGLTLGSEFGFGQFVLRADIDRPDNKGSVEVRTEAGQFKGGLDAALADYSIGLGRTAVTARRNLPDLDYPNVTMSLDEFGYGLSAGIGDLLSPQQGRVWARLIGLTIPPEVWAQADPSGVLQSGPITASVDLSGTYALTPEMLAPGWQPVPETFPPMDLIDLTLGKLLFEGVGVTLTGGGSLRFDEADLVTYPGFPAPTGKVSFQAAGVNGLLDRIVAAGLMPAEELTAFRMGLMFIAKAGATPDSLVSEVEFREKSFYLNGMKLR